MVGDGAGATAGAPLDRRRLGQRGTLVEQAAGDKIIVFKKKRRHNYRRKNGHRQQLDGAADHRDPDRRRRAGGEGRGGRGIRSRSHGS